MAGPSPLAALVSGRSSHRPGQSLDVLSFTFTSTKHVPTYNMLAFPGGHDVRDTYRRSVCRLDEQGHRAQSCELDIRSTYITELNIDTTNE